MLIVDGEVEGRPGVDVRVVGERVTAVGSDLRRRPGEDVIDAAGGAVIPALHDHHVHLGAMAAALASVPVGPPAVTDPDGLDRALRTAPGEGWIRAVGYHESVAGDLDRHRLDAAVTDRPCRVQHRSGALWVLNSAALAAVDAADHPTGRLWRHDQWLADRVPAMPLDLGTVSRRAAAHGIAGFTDADPHRTQADVDLLARIPLLQNVVLMGGDRLLLPAPLQAGPRKILLDDATLPAVADLAASLAGRHPVAVHCVTRLQLVATLAAFADAGTRAGNRIEHGGVVPVELRAELRRLGLTVVTQPNFVAERGDQYLADVDPDDRPLLYPCASLRAAGVAVAAGTDAPFGDPDPWAAMRAAVHRRTPSGQVLGPDERVTPAVALDLFLGHPDAPAVARRVAPGAPADLCVLDRPLAALHAALAAEDAADLNPAALTVARGAVIADNR